MRSHERSDDVAARPAFTWREDFELGHAGMDRTHREFVVLVAAMLDARDEELSATLEAFGVHAKAHFTEEDRQMAETAYGNAGCHVDEHAAVLKSFGEVRDALAAGRKDVVRSFARALADWFPGHAQVMDQGLALWLVQRQLGGAPVRIQRQRSTA
jgi:hemerythrin-like metal-binding protein